ncbi:hypothetical protein LJC03_06000, partial [Methanobrevibacter sp. OttesenSCG-928-I08]|nr:hypothetical protein [Methanobrevibacter sp. OttesenSCG-928-I08]
AINGTVENGILNLDDDVIWESDFADGIQITKNITINGKGHVIDAKESARIFTVAPKVNFVLLNITLKNGYHNSAGGAIYNNGGIVNIAGNTSFINNSANISGGAISDLNGIIIVDGTQYMNVFENNSVNTGNKSLGTGGAIGSHPAGKNGTFYILGTNIFKDNLAFNGGAIRNPYLLIINGNTTFLNNHAFDSVGNNGEVKEVLLVELFMLEKISL